MSILRNTIIATASFLAIMTGTIVLQPSGSENLTVASVIETVSVSFGMEAEAGVRLPSSDDNKQEKKKVKTSPVKEDTSTNSSSAKKKKGTIGKVARPTKKGVTPRKKVKKKRSKPRKGLVAKSPKRNATCRRGFKYDARKKKCFKIIRRKMNRQDTSASGGRQWGPVNQRNCTAASKEMVRSMAICKRYDIAQAVGKTLDQCATCCRQLREGVRRWRACYKAGFYKKRVDQAYVKRSKRKLGCTW